MLLVSTYKSKISKHVIICQDSGEALLYKIIRESKVYFPYPEMITISFAFEVSHPILIFMRCSSIFLKLIFLSTVEICLHFQNFGIIYWSRFQRATLRSACVCEVALRCWDWDLLCVYAWRWHPLSVAFLTFWYYLHCYKYFFEVL